MQHGNATKIINLLTLPRVVRPPAWAGQTAPLGSDSLGAVRPPQETGPAPNFSKPARTTLNTFQKLPGAQNMHKVPPLLTMHESKENAKSFNIELLKYTKFNIECDTCPNEQVRYSIAS
jgi:hypothetical protein